MISNKAEVAKIDKKEEPNLQSARGQKRPPREGAAKAASPSQSTETPTVSKRRRSRRSVADVQATPSRRTRTSNAVATASRVRSGMQTRRSTVEKEKADRQTRSRKQKQGVETREGKAVGNRSRRWKSEGGKEKVVVERKRKNAEVEEPTVSTRRRTSLPIQPLVATASPRKRTRASTSTPSSRLSTRQRR